MKSAKLSLIEIGANHVRKILSTINGMKLLLLDKETSVNISSVFSQTELLDMNVVLVEQLEMIHRLKEPMPHLNCVIICKATNAVLEYIKVQLKNPKYGDYSLFFTTRLRHEYLKILAQSDAKSKIVRIEEIFNDFFVVGSSLFKTSESVLSSGELDSLVGVFLALRKTPTEIRYAKGKVVCQRLASSIKEFIRAEADLCSFGSGDRTLLLILDRFQDPVTPLLLQWTYQAMVHELIGIENNRIKLSAKEEVIFSEVADPFYAQHLNSNFGDLGEAIKNLLEKYQSLSKSNKNISTVDDMQNFVQQYPEFKKFSANVSKHVSLMGQLAHKVEEERLLEISQLEQEMVSDDDYKGQVQSLRDKLNTPHISDLHCLRLTLLFALKYGGESAKDLAEFTRLLSLRGMSKQNIALVGFCSKLSVSSLRADIFSQNNSLLSKGLKMASKAVQGVSNVYTQHEPLVSRIVSDLLKGRLLDSNFPDVSENSTAKNKRITAPKNVIIYITNGVTLEENVHITRLASENPGVQIVLGGKKIHNSTTFMSLLQSYRNTDTQLF
eukprot:maker-scaffold_12-snap-gene-7.50-mRNA-1 protein AED:0.03 eAED:0.03 QI:27/1/1/1/0.6/0.66/6/290/552